MRKFIEEKLKEMVRIDSHSSGSMDEIIEYTTDLLEEIGLEPRVVEAEGSSPVILASHGEGGVCFSGHLDTVPVGDGWEHEQGEIVDDRMYGRGTLDMKGPCVSAIAAARNLLKKDVPFSLAFTTDEEVTMNGAGHVAGDPEITEAPVVLVCEPTGMLVVTEEKGVFQFEVTTRGENAHASMPDKGDNAISKMLPVLNELDSKNNIPAGGDEISCCIDVIEGGEATNVIPKECQAEIDVRFPARFDRQSIEDELFENIEQELELREIQYLEAVKIEEDRKCIQDMLAIADTDLWTVPYATEMVMYYQNNEDTFIFGPGRVDVAHKPDEYIDVPELVEAADIYIEYAEVTAYAD